MALDPHSPTESSFGDLYKNVFTETNAGRFRSLQSLIRSTLSNWHIPGTAMALDQKILELRLLIKESSVNQASIQRCATKLQTFGKNVHDNAALDAVLKEFLLNQLENEKSKNYSEALDGQSEEYSKLERVIQERVTHATDSIAKLEEELRQQQIVRAHRVECEKTAGEVSKHPSRSNLKRKIDSVSATLASTQASIELVDNEIEQKKLLVANIAQSIMAVQSFGKVVVEDENKVAETEDADGAEDEDRDTDRGNRTNKSDRDSTGEGENAENAEVELDEDGNPIEAEGEGEENEGNEGEEDAQESAAMEE